MDAALLALNEKQVKEKEMKDLKKDVRILKRTRQVLTDRENKIRSDINRGEFRPISSYKLPLAVSQADNKKAATSLSEAEIQTLKRTANIKQKLQAVAICYGITSIRDEAEDETVFMMDPYIAGRPYGPYSIRLRMSSPGPSLRSNTLPSAVPVKALFSKYCLADGESRDTNIRAFLSNTFRHLRAYLSRLQQFNDLKERFSRDLIDCNAVNHFTAISFSLSADMKEDEEQKVIMKMSMVYDLDGERPREQSVKVTFDPQVDDETMQDVEEDCEVFYRMTLLEALTQTFLE